MPSLRYIKRQVSRGKVYYYFRAGVIDGKEVLRRMPPRADASWGRTYASYLAAREARQRPEIALTVADVSRRYQHSKAFTGRADSTQNTYLIYLRKIEDALGEAGIDQVERRDVQAMMDKMADRPGAATMLLLVLRALFRHALEREFIKVDPSQHVAMPEEGDHEHEPWPEDLLEAALASDDRTVRLAVALLYYTAQRIGDVCKMRWSDLRDGYVHVTQQKTGKELAFPIHAELLRHLADVPKDAMTILRQPTGKPMRVATLRSNLKAWAAKRDHAVVPHGLRKNAVNTLLEMGCSVAEVSAISGQTLKTVEHYAKRRDNRRIGGAAILKWERGTERGSGKRVENK